jgi:hypothetical protein
MARTFTTLQKGDPEIDCENVIAMHLKIKSLESENAELKHRNDQLTKVLKRLSEEKTK